MSLFLNKLIYLDWLVNYDSSKYFITEGSLLCTSMIKGSLVSFTWFYGYHLATTNLKRLPTKQCPKETVSAILKQLSHINWN